MKKLWETFNKTCARLGIKPAERVLLVCIETQTMRFFRANKLVRTFAISTSKRPPSNIRDSLGTPRGLHEIAERIGGEQPSGMVFKARQPTGLHYEKFPAETENATDTATLVTSRILWLRGLEPGVNNGGDVDSHERYIYIHGTNREDLIGTPQSSGCVVMRNLDIIDLYEHVHAGDHVMIE